MARFGSLLLASTLLAGVLAACSAATEEDTDGTDDAVTAERSVFDETPLVANGKDEPIAVPAAGTLVTEIAQPELLFQLEKDGFHFTNMMDGEGRLDNATLLGSSDFYAKLVASIGADLEGLAQANKTATVKVEYGKDRLFDAGWLKSKNATFDLVSVVNRIDRKDFAPDTCGETRFVYRLSYVRTIRNAPTFSRLPFFFNVVFDNPGGDCAARARSWQVPAGLSPDAYTKWLEDGALSLAGLKFKQIELNAQVMRTPSESKRDMGGLAFYFLRVYDMKDGALSAKPLENTPDVAKLAADPALKAELLAWIKDNVKGIDEGTAVMPAKFAATRAQSFTTFGSTRLANKLFSQLFTRADLEGLDFSETKLLASPESVLFRLDDMTCAGCHQGRSVAGFHLLGAERGTRTNPLNALRTHASPHFLAEQPRREAWIRGLLEGAADPQRATSFDPPPGVLAPAGTHCVLPADASKLKQTWSCAAGLECKPLATNAKAAIELGQCLPKSGGFAGLPCIGGAMSDASDPHADKLATKNLGCGGSYSCLKPEEGTPGGMCVARCKGKLGEMAGANEICAYGGGAKFDQCAASGNFQACIGGAVRPAPRQACDEDNPCREDYMCQRLEPIEGKAPISTTPATKGFCNPTYFIFQMRVDGHPKPEG
ncbi:MAG: hypothetical protein KIT84_32045 [Labilithrix sp.]|nr:hypothetical protein [Labilithrix sp.]MCW5815704.1 hypothetical protein [Labilithrix sp.]